MPTFKSGDLVVIVTVNGGRTIQRKREEETWAGKIFGPSAMGEGWWLVHRIDPATGRRRSGPPITVPETEMKQP